MPYKYRGPFLVVAILFSSALLGELYGPNLTASTYSVEEIQSGVRDFTQVLGIVQANYAQPVDMDRAVYQGAIPGMLRVLDPHSHFFNQQDWAENTENREGKYYGVGMVVESHGNHVAVLEPYADAPAFQAGIRSGDVIEKVDDKSAEGMSTSDIATLLKGAQGTAVKVTVLREGYQDPLVFTVTRGAIPRHSVELAFAVKPGVGYVRLSGFLSQQTSRELVTALNQLNPASLDGLVLDMRGNPGGLLDEAVAVSDMFLEKNQLIVSEHGRTSPEFRFYATHGNRGLNIPLVVLVNHNSASATEIVSGAIQDHDRGLIVGETTFGKGLVQGLSPLSENTGLALTTARYYTPSGRLIQRDYKSLTLYEYYEHKIPTHPSEVKLTDTGRQVTGGGGITPDIAVAEPQFTSFQELLIRSQVFSPYDLGSVDPHGVGEFTRYYLGTRPAITQDFVASDAVLQQLRAYLAQRKISYTDVELTANLDWIKHEIRQEVLEYSFGETEGLKTQVQTDSEVQRAVEALPKANALYQNARKIIAQRIGNLPAS